MLAITLKCPQCSEPIKMVKKQNRKDLIVICMNCGEINVIEQNRNYNPIEETKRKLPDENYWDLEAK